MNTGPDKTNELAGWCAVLYRAKASELLLYGRALGLSHGEAEDVLQETFIALLTLEYAPENPLHYAIRAFRNRVLNYRRSVWRRLTRELEAKRWFDPSPPIDPTETFAMEALRKLPAEQREVIVLKIWHQYTFEEIGDLLKISPNTVSGRYRYGIEKIRNALKGNHYERTERVGDGYALLGDSPPVAEG